jgi:HNH endonuclease/GYF domain 2
VATEWRFRANGVEDGPVTAQQLLALAREKRLSPDDLVQKGNDGKWVRAAKVQGLFEEPTEAVGAAPRTPRMGFEERTDAAGVSRKTPGMRIKDLPPRIYVEFQDEGKSKLLRRTDEAGETFFFLVWSEPERAKAWLQQRGAPEMQFGETERDVFMFVMMNGATHDDLIICDPDTFPSDSSVFRISQLTHERIIRLNDVDEKCFIVESFLRKTSTPDKFIPVLLQELRENPQRTPNQILESGAELIQTVGQIVERERTAANSRPGPCTRCGETQWESVEVSPTVKSVRWRCGFCGRQLISKCDSDSPIDGLSRAPIPKAIQRDVWQRDNGRCVECGSRENIEFDHIIPLSKGGSSTTRNIQLLCQNCNRQKSSKAPGSH